MIITYAFLYYNCVIYSFHLVVTWYSWRDEGRASGFAAPGGRDPGVAKIVLRKGKILIFVSKQILHYCEKLKEIKEVTVIVEKFYNFCNGLPSWLLSAEAKKPSYTSAYMYPVFRPRM